ncbi:unnamed protein product [Sympodiomycopsis kandeliae]
MPSIKRRRQDVQADSETATPELDQIVKGSSQQRKRFHLDSETPTESDATPMPPKRKRAAVFEDDDDDGNADQSDHEPTTSQEPDSADEDDGNTTTLNTSITVSPTQASSFVPKKEPESMLLNRVKNAYTDQQSSSTSTSEDEIDPDRRMEDDDDEFRDEEEDELAQRHAQTEQPQGRGLVAEAGVIQEVILRDFMCHKYLTVTLRPQMNFIAGHNGSGKSAILTAITIALGGKASSTSRANSVKSFVREGCQAAQVTLVIANKGADAFKHSEYGDKIIIERRINADGGGHWKMKSKDGKTVSSKRQELTAFCDHANIQVDNPMNVLTQDAARQFLSGANPSQMYEFFLTATQLDHLDEEYSRLTGILHRMDLSNKREEENIPELKRAAMEALHKVHLLEKQKDLRSREEILKNQLVWSQVVALEKSHEKLVTSAEHVKGKIAKLEVAIRDLAQERETINERITDLESRGKQDGERNEPLHRERQELRSTIQALKNKLSKTKEEEREHNNQYTRLDKNLQHLQQRIDEETAKLAQDNREKHRQIEARRSEVEERIRSLSQQEVELRDSLRDGDSQSKRLYGLEAGATEKRERLRSEVQNAQSYMQKLEATSRNSMEAFGQDVPKLLRAIAQEGRWHRKPVGPIGSFVKLKDTKWAKVLESVIGNTLNAFCVVDHHDRRLLESVKRRIGCGSVSILTASDEAFDFSGGEPPADVLTILRVLEVSDEYVLRQLVNAVHIESSALVEHRPDGDQLMRRGVRNVKHCFSADMYRLGGGAIGSSTQTLNPYKGTPRLTADLQGKIDETKIILEQTQKDLGVANEELKRAQSERRQLEDSVRNNRQKLSAIGKQQHKARSDLAQVEDEMREDEPANMAAIEEARRDAREELDKCKSRFEELQSEKEAIESELRPQVERSEELKRQIEQTQDEVGAVKLEITKAIRERVQNQQTEKMRNESLTKSQADLKRLEEDEEERKLEVEHATEQALEYTEGERVEATRSREFYEREIQAVESLLEQARRQSGGTLEQAQMEYNAKSKASKDAEEQIELSKAIVKSVRRALEKRIEMWKFFRRHISLSARSSFVNYLAYRAYTGKLVFDHERKRLVVSVQTDETNQQTQQSKGSGGGKSQRKDPKSLSGGEKSFSTVCLLLALWQAIGCPLRCLDEFDVFMDAVNRRTSMNLMVESAKDSPGVQYILITPQSMANAKFGPEVNIQKLGDPERGQGTLDYGAA